MIKLSLSVKQDNRGSKITGKKPKIFKSMSEANAKGNPNDYPVLSGTLK
jgi:hypothetical protein